MKNIRSALAVCGISVSCDDLVSDAARLTAKMGARLTVLLIADDPLGLKGLGFPRPALKEDVRRTAEKAGRNLQRVTTRMRREYGIEIEVQLRVGRTLDQILAAVEEEKIDLLLLSARAETRLQHVLFGGMNKTLLREMPCSILFVKSDQRVAVVDEEEAQGESAEAAA